MTFLSKTIMVVPALILSAQLALAGDSPQEQRHELMEDVGGAAKTIGKMLEGESPFDAAAAMEAMNTWDAAAAPFGDLFPEGTESGYDTKAKPSVWSDREGFEAALAAWAEAVDAAIAADPQDLEALQSAVGPVFKKCKACHQEYRVKDE